MTAYIPLKSTTLNPEGANPRGIKAELQVEPSEAYDDHLDLRVHGRNTGESKVELTLDREQATQLQAALAEFTRIEKGRE